MQGSLGAEQLPQAVVRAAVAGGLQPLPRLWQELGIILVALPPFGLGKDLGQQDKY